MTGPRRSYPLHTAGWQPRSHYECAEGHRFHLGSGTPASPAIVLRKRAARGEAAPEMDINYSAPT